MATHLQSRALHTCGKESVWGISWSLDFYSTQPSEEPFSYGYGKKSTNSWFENYKDKFSKNDVFGCFVDFECEIDMELSFTKNGN